MHSASELNDDLLRPEPALRESDSRGGVVFIGLVFAGMAIFATSTNNLHQIANISVKCPIAAISYCDRQ
jgi:hypothetical protein